MKRARICLVEKATATKPHAQRPVENKQFTLRLLVCSAKRTHNNKLFSLSLSLSLWAELVAYIKLELK